MTRFLGPHVNQNEGLLFPKSSPGKKAYRLAERDGRAVDTSVDSPKEIYVD